MVGLRIVIGLALFTALGSCSREVREAGLDYQFTGQRGRYEYIVSLRPAPGFDWPEQTPAAYTSWPRPNLPQDISQPHPVILSWEPGVLPGWRQARFSAEPPVKEMVLVFPGAADRLRTFRLTAPEPAVDLPHPDRY
jgi:hypothetical protein